MVLHSRHGGIFVLLKLRNELFTKINHILDAWIFRLKQVVVDEVRLVQVLLEFVKALSRLRGPLVSIFEEPVGHPLQPTYLILDKLQVCLQNALRFLLLDLQHCFQFVELLFEVVFELVGLHAELGVHLVHGVLVDTILRDVIYDLIHLNEQLRPNGELIDHLLLHAHIMAFVSAEKCTRGADALAALDADDF